MSQPDSRSSASLLLAAPAGVLLAIIVGAVCVALAFGGSAAGCGTASSSASAPKFKGVPPKLVPLYQGAAAEYHLGPKGPSILASVNFNESSFGTNMGNPPGAYGWMSFLPESWSSFGVDGNGDGAKDAYDPEDAIPAAANLLAYLGAPGNWHDAIYGYNHAEWYVENVLGDAAKWPLPSIEGSAGGSCEAPTEAVAAMIAEADRLSAMRPHTEYVWGGSHTLTPTPPNGPFDCSSAVSHELQVGGFKNPTMDTVALAKWGEPGPGKWVTILVKPYEPEAHTVLKFMPGVTPPDKRYWGTSGFIERDHGPGWIPESTFDAGYLARFTERHPPGL